MKRQGHFWEKQKTQQVWQDLYAAPPIPIPATIELQPRWSPLCQKSFVFLYKQIIGLVQSLESCVGYLVPASARIHGSELPMFNDPSSPYHGTYRFPFALENLLNFLIETSTYILKFRGRGWGWGIVFLCKYKLHSHCLVTHLTANMYVVLFFIFMKHFPTILQMMMMISLMILHSELLDDVLVGNGQDIGDWWVVRDKIILRLK